MTTHSPHRDWLSIAAEISIENDPAKLSILIDRLCCALDERKKAAFPLPSKSQS